MIDLTDIFYAIITLIIAIVTTFVIPYIKSKMSTERFETIQSWVKVAVQAAEMIYAESGMGDVKKEYVMEFLNARGYDIDYDALNNLIEAAVLELKQDK